MTSMNICVTAVYFVFCFFFWFFLFFFSFCFFFKKKFSASLDMILPFVSSCSQQGSPSRIGQALPIAKKKTGWRRGGSLADLVDTLGLSEGRLDVQRLDVLPVLLQQGHQEVDRLQGVLTHLLGLHVDVSDHNSKVQVLLQLELDGGAHGVDLLWESGVALQEERNV